MSEPAAGPKRDPEPSPPTDDALHILWSAFEDYCGVWEAEWELRSMHPETSDRELRDRAEAILRLLWENGWIAFWHITRGGEDPRELGPDEVTAALARRVNWEPRLLTVDEWSGPAGHARFGITELGEAALRQYGWLRA